MITVSIDTKPRDLRKMVQKLGRTFTQNHKRAMRRAAAEGLNRIQKRTSLGLDIHEQPFRPYSEAYKGFRKSKGRQSIRLSSYSQVVCVSRCSRACVVRTA